MRNRIIETIEVKASELIPNALNPREHGDTQRGYMRAVLEEIGFVAGLMGVRTEGGRIRLINGHMRAGIAGDELVPVNIVDLSPDEERKVLATFDPIGELATTNAKAANDLIATVKTNSEEIEDLLESLIKRADPEDVDEVVETVLDQAVQLRPEREYVVILCNDAAEWDAVRAALALQMVRRGGYKIGSAYDDTGIERVIPAARLLGVLNGAGKDSRRVSDGASS